MEKYSNPAAQLVSHIEISKLCSQFHIQDYVINIDGSIDVYGDVKLRGHYLDTLPLRFNKIHGDFDCQSSMLTTLKGGPIVVLGDFDCTHNLLITLEGAPDFVGGSFFCTNNINLTTLKGSPKTVRSGFYCSFTPITNLDGISETIGGSVTVDRNRLTTLLGGPKIVKGDFHCCYNYITSLVGFPEIVHGNFIHTNCSRLESTYSGDIDIDIGNFIDFTRDGFTGLPHSLRYNIKHLKLILKYQRHFEIWNDNLTLNEENFYILLSEIKDGLE